MFMLPSYCESFPHHGKLIPTGIYIQAKTIKEQKKQAKAEQKKQETINLKANRLSTSSSYLSISGYKAEIRES